MASWEITNPEACPCCGCDQCSATEPGVACDNDCCPPAALCATVTAATGILSGFLGATGDFTYNPATEKWEGEIDAGGGDVWSGALFIAAVSGGSSGCALFHGGTWSTAACGAGFHFDGNGDTAGNCGGVARDVGAVVRWACAPFLAVLDRSVNCLPIGGGSMTIEVAPGPCGGAFMAAKAAAVRAGPGTELEKMLKGLKARGMTGCGCKALARWMDRIGPGGCRENAGLIVDRLNENWAAVRQTEKISVVLRAAASRLAFVVDPRDPAPGLLAEAIRRAEAATQV